MASISSPRLFQPNMWKEEWRSNLLQKWRSLLNLDENSLKYYEPAKKRKKN